MKIPLRQGIVDVWRGRDDLVVGSIDFLVEDAVEINYCDLLNVIYVLRIIDFPGAGGCGNVKLSLSVVVGFENLCDDPDYDCDDSSQVMRMIVGDYNEQLMIKTWGGGWS